MKDKVLWIILVALGAAIITGLVQLGRHQVQAEWDKEKANTALEIERLKGVVSKKEDEHSAKVKEITTQMDIDRHEYETTLANNKSDYAKRLLTIQGRANVYERYAQGTATERDRLAKHAAELDRSLEEGRALVRDLGATIGQRDAAIRALGSIILTDRNLIN